MLFKSLAVTAVLASSASAHLSARNVTRSCGTPHPTEAQIRASQQMLQQERARVASGELRSFATITVDTYFHVIAGSESEDDGYATVRKPACPVLS